MNKLFKDVNWPIILGVVLLLSISILILYSSSPELAAQQLIFSLVGIFLYFLMSEFNYRILAGFVIPGYLLICLLLIIVLILGIETRGVVRWIPLGIFNIQPSEFAKPIMIIFLANFWSNNIPNWTNIFKSLLWIAPIFFLIFKQPDLGTALIVLSIWVGLVFAARISFKKIILLISFTAVFLPLIWINLHDYQRQRVTSFLSPDNDPLGVGYNLIQSTIAVGSGQLFGRGLGQGTQSRLQFLPEYRTDFIFASTSEELGFLGVLVILLTYISMLTYFIRTAESSSDAFGYLLILGVVTMLLFQIVVNIGMNIGIFPITGITLPLISYGGSSLISTLISLGLVASVIKFRKRIDIHTIGG